MYAGDCLDGAGLWTVPLCPCVLTLEHHICPDPSFRSRGTVSSLGSSQTTGEPCSPETPRGRGSGQKVSTALWSRWGRGCTTVPVVGPGHPGTVGEGHGPPASSASYPVSAQRCIGEASPGSLSSGVKGSGCCGGLGARWGAPRQGSLALDTHPLVPGSGPGLRLSALHSRTSALLGSGWAEAPGHLMSGGPLRGGGGGRCCHGLVARGVFLTESGRPLEGT